MQALFSALLAEFAAFFRSHLALQLEIMALRHQLAIYQRSVMRPSITTEPEVATGSRSRLSKKVPLPLSKEL